MLGAISYLCDRQSLLRSTQAPNRWAFETLDPTPRLVTQTDSQNGAAGVSREAAITIWLDQALKVGGQEVEFVLTGQVEKPMVSLLAEIDIMAKV